MLRTSIVALAFVAPIAVHAQPAQPAKPDLQKGGQIAEQVCAACHGADGNSGTPANPKLAQQHADYLVKQLQDFKVAEGEKTAERPSAVMAGFAATLSEADMRNVAAFYASKQAKPGKSKSPSTTALGMKIWRGGIAEKSVPACAGCHGPAGAGIPAQYPRLAGQHAEYVQSQLESFRSGKRANSPQMNTIAARLSDAEIAAVSDYAEGLNAAK